MAERWLVVDDLRVVGDLSYFKDPPVVTHVETTAAGIQRLTDEEFDILWLDHDLGPDGTIMPLVDWLSERAFNGDPVKLDAIVVHSANPTGVATMLQTLARYGYEVVRGTLPR